MKIAYIPQNDPYNKNSWSGTDYYVRKCLEDQGHNVYCIYGLTVKKTLSDYCYKLVAKVRGTRFLEGRTAHLSKRWARFIKRKIQPNTDVILSLGTVQVAYLNVSIPIVVWVDGVFEQLRKDYRWDNISKASIDSANELEQLAINRCSKFFVCSLETKLALKKYYKIEDTKIEIVQLGANLDKVPSFSDVQKYIVERLRLRGCNLLFVGVRWYRKGADIVLKVLEILNKRHFPAKLHLVGIKDVPVELPSNVINHGFVSKNDKDGAKKLEDLFCSSHFLFVPSRAEAYGLVFCEASAFGLPSISHHVGGIYTIINEENGKLFTVDTPPEKFADYIIEAFKDKDKYRDLCFSSYKRFTKTLNWKATGEQVTAILQSIV